MVDGAVCCMTEGREGSMVGRGERGRNRNANSEVYLREADPDLL